VGDRVLMLQNTWYSVISPESCSSILWRSWDYKEQAASALKLTAEDMKENKLIDGVIKEPMGGAHANPEKMYELLKKEISKHLDTLCEKPVEQLIKTRREKFYKMGVFN
jgi:acetyl-CoA carboxylase carboxyl transferase subunit alpha